MPKSFHLIAPYLKEKRLLIIIGFSSLISVDIMQLILPRIIRRVIDDLAEFRMSGERLAVYALWISLIAVMTGMFRYGWLRCIIGMSRRVEEGLRNQLFAHLQTLSASYFNTAKTGDLMAHATSDIQHVQMGAGMGMVALIDALFMGIVAIAFMCYINLTLTAFAMIPAPIVVFGTRFFSRKIHHIHQQVQASFSDLTEVVRERLAGIRIIKAYNKQTDALSRLEEKSEKLVRQNLKLAKFSGAFYPLMLFISNLSMMIVLYLGGRQTIFKVITPGDFVAFTSYLGLLTWPMMALGWTTNLIQRAAASLERLNAILQQKSDIAELADAIDIESFDDKIVFQDIGFSYSTDRQTVLNRISFELEQGKMLGIIGPPGSGKTALLQLFPRLYDVSDGKITIDGHDLRSLKVASLRRFISFMPQEPFLFDGSIRDNITFGNPDISEDALQNAIRNAALEEIITLFPNGLDTITGERGVVLSGGQKQRVTLARALLRDTRILILDDPVSQVDMETGAKIIETIRAMAGQRTIVLASHRLSAVRFADHIMVLEDGKITELGNHEKLMKNDGYYAKTFRMQQIEEELLAVN